jgi:hypothetical protein
VAGISKRPQPPEINRGTGISYVLDCLVPARVGRLYCTAVIHEGVQTGLKYACHPNKTKTRTKNKKQKLDNKHKHNKTKQLPNN